MCRYLGGSFRREGEDVSWWRMQQSYVDSSGNHFRHDGHLKPSRWEDRFPKEWLFEQQTYWIGS